MPSTVGKYKLGKTLGEGWNSKVKVAVDSETGKSYAMKIMFVEDAEGQEDFDISLFLTLMNNEVERLEKLPKSDNIIQLIEYNWKGVMKTGSKEKEVLYWVLELATGGDLFDYIFTVGRGLPENIARYYFHKLIDSIQYMHENNVVHKIERKIYVKTINEINK